MCREVRDAIHKRVRRAQIVDALVYSQILIAAQNPSGQLFAASEKPRRDLVPESNMLFIGAAASRGKSARYIRPYGECTDADPCWCQMDPGAACARFYDSHSPAGIEPMPVTARRAFEFTQAHWHSKFRVSNGPTRSSSSLSSKFSG